MFEHTGCEGQLLRLTRGQQPLIEVPDDGVEASVYQRSHVESGAARARPPHTVRLPRSVPLSPLNGATPTSAAICRRSSVPSSGRYARRVRESCFPTPGTVRRRSSFSLHTGLES